MTELRCRWCEFTAADEDVLLGHARTEHANEYRAAVTRKPRRTTPTKLQLERERTAHLLEKCACGAEWAGLWVERAADIIAMHRERWNGQPDRHGIVDKRCGPVT